MNQTHESIKEKLWTSEYLKIMVVGFLIMFCYNISNSTMPLYVQQVGGNKSAAGLAAGVFTIAALLFRPFVGNLVDTKGRKIILIIGIVIFSLASLSFSFFPIVWIIILLRVIQGVGFSVGTTATGTAVSDIIPSSRIMEGIGFYGLSNALATAIGPAIGLYLAQKAGFKVTYISAFVFITIGLVIAFFVNYEQKQKKQGEIQSDLFVQDTPESKAEKPKHKGVILEKTAIPTSAVMFFAALAQASITSFLPSYAKFRGINNIGLFFTVYAMALMITRPTTGRLSDRFGANKIILPGIVVLIISLIAMSSISSLPGFLMIGVIYGLGYGSVQPVLNALTIKFCPPEKRGAGNATFMCAIDAGYGFGSIIWGIVSQYAGFSVIYIGSAGCVVISGLLYLLLLRKRLKIPSPC